MGSIMLDIKESKPFNLNLDSESRAEKGVTPGCCHCRVEAPWMRGPRNDLPMRVSV